jgi:hypothetical protein
MNPATYYVVKVKGLAKIPDYIQVRDKDFTLIGYFRPHRNGGQHLANDPNRELFIQIEALAQDLPFGVVNKIEL